MMRQKTLNKNPLFPQVDANASRSRIIYKEKNQRIIRLQREESLIGTFLSSRFGDPLVSAHVL